MKKAIFRLVFLLMVMVVISSAWFVSAMVHTIAPLFLSLWHHCQASFTWFACTWLFIGYANTFILRFPLHGPCRWNGDSLERMYFWLLFLTGPVGLLPVIALALGDVHDFITRTLFSNVTCKPVLTWMGEHNKDTVPYMCL